MGEGRRPWGRGGGAGLRNIWRWRNRAEGDRQTTDERTADGDGRGGGLINQPRTSPFWGESVSAAVSQSSGALAVGGSGTPPPRWPAAGGGWEWEGSQSGDAKRRRGRGRVGVGGRRRRAATTSQRVRQIRVQPRQREAPPRRRQGSLTFSGGRGGGSTTKGGSLDSCACFPSLRYLGLVQHGPQRATDSAPQRLMA